MLETVSASVSFTWLAAGQVTLDAKRLPTFPALPHCPGLYRFGFLGAPVCVLYVGESGDLAGRAGQYRHATVDRKRGRTSRRIHKELIAHLTAGGTVDFAIATRASHSVDGEPVDLRLRSARRLAENAAVLLAQLDSDVEVLNIDADLPAE
jgi:hypothetical protein